MSSLIERDRREELCGKEDKRVIRLSSLCAVESNCVLPSSTVFLSKIELCFEFLMTPLGRSAIYTSYSFLGEENSLETVNEITTMIFINRVGRI